MKKIIKYIVCSMILVLGLAFVFYLLLSRYYEGSFSYNTWINGVYCTGKSVNEINAELLSQYEYDEIFIYDAEGNLHMINPEDIGMQHDYTDSLTLYVKRQNPYLWVDNVIKSQTENRVSPVITYDRERLNACVEELPFFEKDLKEQDKELKIKKTQEGYVLINERVQALNRAKALDAIASAVERGDNVVDLKEEGCFEDLPLTRQMEQELEMWEKVEAFQDCRIVYKMGEDLIAVDASVVCEWITVEENGDFIVDVNGDLILNEEKIVLFIEELAKEYDTVGAARVFRTTDGRSITVEGGIYGNKLDQKSEIEYLTEAFKEKLNEVHIPAYLQTAVHQGKNDIGDTYIEIDMTRQKMYYYQNGKLLIETDIVTGNISRKWGTPEGVNYVYAKQTNRILRGEGYASPVKYWMPVKGNIGIHDASWRKTFGEEIYKTDGSHGCINTPLDEVTKLYEAVEVGTPCIMFY